MSDQPRRFTTPPSTAEIEALAERALAGIPPKLRRHIAGVGIMVEELADDATLDEMGIESPYDLTGLYSGTPLHQRHTDDPIRMPDTVHLYRQAILLEWIELGEDLHRLVRNVVIHEIAHHFGFSDAEIEALEQDK
jgi:acetylglutamate kinase